MKTRFFAHQVTDRSYFEIPQLSAKDSRGVVDRATQQMPAGWELLTVHSVQQPLQRRAFAGNCVHFPQPQPIAS